MVCQFPYSPIFLSVFRHCNHGSFLSSPLPWLESGYLGQALQEGCAHVTKYNHLSPGLGTSHQTVLSAVHLFQQWSYALKLYVAWHRFTLLLGLFFNWWPGSGLLWLSMRFGVELQACLACFCSKLCREAACARAYLFCLGCIVRVSFSVSILLVSPKLVFIMLIPDLFLYDPSVRLRLPHTSCGRPAVCWNSGFSVLQVLFV